MKYKYQIDFLFGNDIALPAGRSAGRRADIRALPRLSGSAASQLRPGCWPAAASVCSLENECAQIGFEPSQLFEGRSRPGGGCRSAPAGAGAGADGRAGKRSGRWLDGRRPTALPPRRHGQGHGPEAVCHRSARARHGGLARQAVPCTLDHGSACRPYLRRSGPVHAGQGLCPRRAGGRRACRCRRRSHARARFLRQLLLAQGPGLAHAGPARSPGDLA